MSKKPSATQRRILEAMRDGNEKTETQMKAAAGWPKGGVRRTMRLMVDNGWVVAVMNNPAGPWVITDKGRASVVEEA